MKRLKVFATLFTILFAATMLIAGITGCSSSDDGPTYNPTFSPDPTPTFYQGTLTGIVTYEENDAPVSNATVEIRQKTQTTDIDMSINTNSMGEYMLTSVPYGNYTITVSVNDTVKLTDTININKAETVKNLVITLAPTEE